MSAVRLPIHFQLVHTMTFKSLNLCSELIDALPKTLQQPTEIQTKTIPAIMQKKDLLALAQTGSGKTLAFGLGGLHNLDSNVEAVQSLIVVPTRELASQVTSSLESFARAVSIRISTLIGGMSEESVNDTLNNRPQLIVATPGRLVSLIEQGSLSLSQCQALVLDEADRLLDMGFWPDVQTIKKSLPAKHQTLLFSATLPTELEQQADALLFKPLKVSVHQKNSVAENIQETLYLVNKGSKPQALISLLQQHTNTQALVFIGAKDNADVLTKKLKKAKLNVEALHGNRTQEERSQILDDFKHGKIETLVATDVMARGIHIDSLPLVINFELPMHSASYVHRVGRTARAGANGHAISLVSHSETDALNAIRQLTERTLPVQSLEGFPVTDKPAAEGTQRKRPPKDKQANRRTAKKKSIKQFKSKSSR